MVSSDIGIILEACQHLLEVALAVQRNKALLYLVERVTCPVECGGLAQHWATTAVDQAADNLVFRVVVRRLRVVAHIEAGKAPNPIFELSLARMYQPVQVKGRQPLPVVHPVKHHRKFAIIHPVPGKGHLGRLGLGILLYMPFPTQLAHII